ncbi:hypothetical protein HAX54_024919 [Datura stramonium]|uniref:Uncharacterized protein n=1 Tax=Datura stramonium TaxID=4076 RepID=A0ABS8UYM2_DATST|nr:hypothetical protein [Datura stramonium]
MSWLRSAVNKAVAGGAGNRNLSRNLRYYADLLSNKLVMPVPVVPRVSEFSEFKQAVKTLEELSVSCRGVERVQLLRRWIVALKEIERSSLPPPVSEPLSSPKSIDSIYTTDDGKNSPREPTLVLYYDPDLGGEPLNFRDVFLSSQALEGMILSMAERSSWRQTMRSIKFWQKAFSSYKEEVLAKKEELLLHAQGAPMGLKINADIESFRMRKAFPNLGLETLNETLKEAVNQLQFLSKMEALLLQKKALLAGTF